MLRHIAIILIFIQLPACSQTNDIKNSSEINRVENTTMNIDELLQKKDWTIKEADFFLDNFDYDVDYKVAQVRLERFKELKKTNPAAKVAYHFYDVKTQMRLGKSEIVIGADSVSMEDIIGLAEQGHPYACASSVGSIAESEKFKELNEQQLYDKQKEYLKISIKNGATGLLGGYLYLLLTKGDDDHPIYGKWDIKLSDNIIKNPQAAKEAFQITEFLADKGHHISPIYLAQMYNLGIGTPVNKERAAFWAYNIDEEFIEDTQIEKTINAIKRQLPAEKQKAIKKESAQWKKNVPSREDADIWAAQAVNPEESYVIDLIKTWK